MPCLEYKVRTFAVHGQHIWCFIIGLLYRVQRSVNAVSRALFAWRARARKEEPLSSQMVKNMNGTFPGLAFLTRLSENNPTDVKNPSEKLFSELPSIGCPRCAALRMGATFRKRSIRNAYFPTAHVLYVYESGHHSGAKWSDLQK